MALDSIVSLLENLSHDVAPVLVEAVKEAAEARQAVQIGEGAADPVDISDLLIGNRRQIERLEYLTSTLVLIKSRSSNAVAARQAAYDDKIMDAANKPSIGFGSYTTADEKKAQFNLAAVEEHMALRKAEKSHRDVDSAWDYCRILLRGAEGVQRDLELRLRAVTLASQLER